MPELTPEEKARQRIDAIFEASGWRVQDKSSVNLQAARGVAVRELSFKTGEPDYTLFVDGKAIGTVEAKPVGHSLIGVEEQSEKYVKGVPFGLPAWRSPLPFVLLMEAGLPPDKRFGLEKVSETGTGDYWRIKA